VSVYSKEFPILTPEANAAAIIGLGYSIDKINSVEIGLRNRIEFAAFLREAMKQAGVTSEIRWTDGSMIGKLFAIVNNLHNLHSPPPPPPTLAQAREADLDTPAGRDVVRDFLAALGEGEP
jgi:hypothetical protein